MAASHRIQTFLPPEENYRSITAEVASIPLRYPAPRAWWIGFGISGVFVVVFVVAVGYSFLVGPGIWGIQSPVFWGLRISNYVWWIGMGHAGTLISALLLLMNKGWRNSLNRFAEAMTVFAVLMAAIEPIVHLGRPWYFYWNLPYPNTMDVWPQFRSPLVWDVFAVGTYLIVSILFWYIGLVPDLATARDRARRPGLRYFFGLLALGWRNSAIHWARWRVAYWTVAGLAVPLVVSVHSGVAMLFAASLEPGWNTTIFPPYFVLGAVFEGFAVVLLIAITLRYSFNLYHVITQRHLETLGKLLLATGLMTAYGYVFEAFTAWYSGSEFERSTLHDRWFGADYAWSYWGAVACNFGLLQLLWFRRFRRSTVVLVAAGLSVTVGMWLERYMLVVTTLYRDFLPSAWQAFAPSFWEWALFAGTIGVFFFLFFLFVRLLPMVSVFELKEALREQAVEEHEERGI